jgi:hypothetical protein
MIPNIRLPMTLHCINLCKGWELAPCQSHVKWFRNASAPSAEWSSQREQSEPIGFKGHFHMEQICLAMLLACFLEHKPLYSLSRPILPKHWKTLSRNRQAAQPKTQTKFTETVPSQAFSFFRVSPWRTKINASLRTMCHQALAAINWRTCEYLWAPVWAPDLNDLRHASFHTFLPFFYLKHHGTITEFSSLNARLEIGLRAKWLPLRM